MGRASSAPLSLVLAPAVSMAFDLGCEYDAMLMAGTILSLISGALIYSLGAHPPWNTNKAD